MKPKIPAIPVGMPRNEPSVMPTQIQEYKPQITTADAAMMKRLAAITGSSALPVTEKILLAIKPEPTKTDPPTFHKISNKAWQLWQNFVQNFPNPIAHLG